jgi:peptidoglycan/LPS O-acetylase OafA/YrhL
LPPTFFFLPKEFLAFSKSVVATTLFSSNILFWYETGYFDAPGDLKPLLHTWSLAVEEQFYFVYPLLLMFCRRVLRSRWIVLLLPLCLISLWASAHAVSSRNAEAAFYLAPFRAWEFLLGTLVAVGAVPRLGHRLGRELLAAFGLALILWSVVTYSEALPFPGLNALAPCLGAALLIWLGGDQQTIVGRALSSPPLVFIGLLSYSIYLWHWPLFVFARYILMQELSWPAQVSLVLATFPLSYLSWRYVELPVRRGSYWKGWRIVVTGAAVTAASLCLGYAAIATDGLPGRIAPEILALKTHQAERGECHDVTVARVDAGDLCVRGMAGEAPSFVLAGDSHAYAISGGVFAAAARAGLSGYQFTANSFRPLPGIKLEKRRLDDLTGKFVDDYDGSGVAYNKGSFQRGLQRLVDSFPDRRFLLVEDVPIGSEFSNAPRAIHMQSLLGGSARLDLLHVGISRQEYERQLASYRPIFAAVAQAPNVSIVPLIDQLCNSQVCSGTRNGALLFYDGDHLSMEGGLALTDTFFRALTQRVEAKRH